MDLQTIHQPVLLKEVIEFLNPKPNENFIDATIGGGGHSGEILERIAPGGKVLGIDRNEEAIRRLKLKIKKLGIEARLPLSNGNFANLKEIVKENNFWPISGILFDLGFSSDELENSGRGFSFLRDEPLVMRYECNAQGGAEKKFLTAMDVVNKCGEVDLEKIFKEYGGEKFSRRIARAVAEERKFRPINTTFDLVKIINKSVPKIYERGRIHPATRVFQSLRIFVNDELENLKKGLESSFEILPQGARMVVVSFHSLEDKMVKNSFKDKAADRKIKILTKKPITPSLREIKNNPRARSAKLRAAEIT